MDQSVSLDFLSAPFQGSVAFVPLDYGSRYEHSVLIVPDRWESLAHLLYAPQEFVNWVRSSFRSTPEYTDGDGQATIAWDLNSPLTIVLQPLTPEPTGAAKVLLGEAGNGAPAFLVQFALSTSVLQIFYQPDHVSLRPWYSGNITPVTFSSVEAQDMNFTHFDLHHDGMDSFDRVSAVRAQIVMDIIENPEVLNQLVQPQRIVNTGGDLYFDASAGFQRADPNTDLVQSATGAQSAPRTYRRGASSPTIVLDSVWTDPMNPIPVCPNNQPPYLCIVTETETDSDSQEEIVLQVTVKWYCPQ